MGFGCTAECRQSCLFEEYPQSAAVANRIEPLRLQEQRGEWAREFKIVNWYSEIEPQKRQLRRTEEHVTVAVTGFSGSVFTAILASKELCLQSGGACGVARFNRGAPS